MARSKPSLWAVVMAGGAGTRFWPVSRRKRPKQLLPAGGGAPRPGGGLPRGAPLLAETAGRLEGLVPPARTLVIGAAPQARAIREALPGLPRHNLILEPEGRNTAPCLGLAAHLVEGWEPDAVVAAFPADHHVGRPAALRRLARAAAGLAAERDAIVTLGVPPRWAETGYGYIERGRKFELPGRIAAYAVRRFTEKPSPARAKRFLASGKHYWNSGIFIARASRIVRELDQHLPETARHLRRAAAAFRKREAAAFRRAFLGCEAISIDRAVMEKARGLVVVPAEIGWSDLGSWTALRAVRPLDEAGNLWILPKGGRHLAEDARGLVVRSAKPLVAALGVENLVVVETEDALLICSADRAASVNALVQRLGAEGLERFL